MLEIDEEIWVALAPMVVRQRQRRDEDRGDDDLYRLVGQATGRFDLDYVEVTTTSPMGMALMKARVGESIRVDLPRGTKRFTIIAIEM